LLLQPDPSSLRNLRVLCASALGSPAFFFATRQSSRPLLALCLADTSPPPGSPLTQRPGHTSPEISSTPPRPSSHPPSRIIPQWHLPISAFSLSFFLALCVEKGAEMPTKSFSPATSHESPTLFPFLHNSDM